MIKSIKLPGYTRMKIYDAKVDITPFPLSEDSMKKGKEYLPSGCAIALEAGKHKKLFPGKFHSFWVYKTFSVLVTIVGDKYRAIRYMNTERMREGINGWDWKKGNSLKIGEMITPLAPTGTRKLGAKKWPGGTPGKTHVTRKPVGSSNPGYCKKRGIFASPLFAAQAEDDVRGKEKVLLCG